MAKGIVRFVLTDVVTGEVREEMRENFIYVDSVRNLLSSSTYIQTLWINFSNKEVFPAKSKNSLLYSFNSTFNGSVPSGSSFSTFYPKTDDSPPYVEFYSMFTPGTGDRYINAIHLSTDTTSLRDISSLNLYPACIQKSTEYLNIYYRVILSDEGDESDNSDYLKNHFTKTIAEYNSIYSDSETTFYPFKIKQDVGKNGFVNFLSTQTRTQIRVTTPTRTQRRVQTMVNRNRVYAASIQYEVYPENPPNQYAQYNDFFFNTVIRGNGVGYHPYKFTKDLGVDGFTGIGNVFSTNERSDSNFFDPTNFQKGSGRMFVSGQYDPQGSAYPSKFVIEVVKTGQTGSLGAYQVREYHRSPNEYLQLAPPIFYGSMEAYHANLKEKYSDTSKVHFENLIDVVKYEENRSFIIFNRLGFNVYNVAEGTLEAFNNTTLPTFNPTDIRNILVDSKMNIWVACANTGLYKIRIDSALNQTEVTQIGVPPGCQNNVFAIALDNSDNIYAIYWGLGLHASSDEGLTWVNMIINYEPFSGYDNGGLDSRWRNVRWLFVDPHSNMTKGDARILIVNHPDASTWAQSGGCWYDQVSANTTGIVNSGFKTILQRVYLRGQTFVLKNGDWGFPGNGGYVETKEGENWYNKITTFKFLSDTTAFKTIHTPGQFEFKHTQYVVEEIFDEKLGRVVEFIHAVGPTNGQTINSETGEVTIDTGSSSSSSSSSSSNSPYYNKLYNDMIGSSNYPNEHSRICLIGKNRCVGLVSFTQSSSFYFHWRTFQHIPETKRHAKGASTIYGWDGGKWVKNFFGGKPMHSTFEPLMNGIQVRFEDGPSGTTSWQRGDQYTFTAFDGYYKDNSTKFFFQDIVYFLPRDIIKEVSPPVVTVKDGSGSVGLVAGPITDDWDTAEIPDVKYSGGPIVTDGDEKVKNVEFLHHLDADAPKIGSVVGSANVTFGDGDVLQFQGGEVNTTRFNAESYIKTQPITASGYFDYTIEMWVKLEESGKLQTLLVFGDMRIEVSKSDRLQVVYGGSVYGNVGPTLKVGEWVFVAFNNNNNNMALSLNGTVISTFRFSYSIPSNQPILIGGLEKQDIKQWTPSDFTPVPVESHDGTMTAASQNVGAIYSTDGFSRRITYLDSANVTYEFIIKPKSGTKFFFMELPGTFVRYDIEKDTFSNNNSNPTVKRERLSGGWLKLLVTTPNTYRNNSFDVKVGFKNTDDYNSREYMSYQATYFGDIAPYSLYGGDSDAAPAIEKNVSFLPTRGGVSGSLSNVRVTTRTQRYEGANHPVPVAPFKEYSNTYDGAKLILSNTFNQGNVYCKRELLGDWAMEFKDFSPNMAKTPLDRPNVVVGISAYPVVEKITDMSLYICAGNGGGFLISNVDNTAWASRTTDALYAVKIEKVGYKLRVYQKPRQEASYSFLTEVDYLYPNAHIVIRQESPSVDEMNAPNVAPSVEILRNGSEAIAYVGNAQKGSGFFHPRFGALECRNQYTYDVALDGTKVTNRRSNFENHGYPLTTEVCAYDNGVLRFNPADAGKAITGEFVAIRY